MEIRKLNDADAGAWWHLQLEALDREPLAFGPTVEEHRSTSIADFAGAIRESGDGSFVLGAFDGERLVAMASFLREAALKERHKGYLRRVYISAEYRRQGLAVKLIDRRLDLAGGDPSLEQILLAVGANNTAAIRTYRKLGFQIYGTEPHALKVGSEYVDEDLMVLRLR